MLSSDPHRRAILLTVFRLLLSKWNLRATAYVIHITPIGTRLHRVGYDERRRGFTVGGYGKTRVAKSQPRGGNRPCFLTIPSV